MTTNERQVPVWLNLDAFSFDPNDVAIVREGLEGFRDAVAVIQRLAPIHLGAIARLHAAADEVTGCPRSDDVREALDAHLGISDVTELFLDLAAIQERFEKTDTGAATVAR